MGQELLLLQFLLVYVCCTCCCFYEVSGVGLFSVSVGLRAGPGVVSIGVLGVGAAVVYVAVPGLYSAAVSIGVIGVGLIAVCAGVIYGVNFPRLSFVVVVYKDKHIVYCLYFTTLL